MDIHFEHFDLAFMDVLDNIISQESEIKDSQIVKKDVKFFNYIQCDPVKKFLIKPPTKWLHELIKVSKSKEH